MPQIEKGFMQICSKNWIFRIKRDPEGSKRVTIRKTNEADETQASVKWTRLVHSRVLPTEETQPNSDSKLVSKCPNVFEAEHSQNKSACWRSEESSVNLSFRLCCRGFTVLQKPETLHNHKWKVRISPQKKFNPFLAFHHLTVWMLEKGK